MEKLHKLLQKKIADGHTLSPLEKDAKMNVLKDLHKMASDHMADKLNGLKKVSVVAPDDKSLKTGLEKAKEIVSDMPGMLEDATDGEGRGKDAFAGGDVEAAEELHHADLDDDDEMDENPEHVEKVLGPNSEEDIDAKIAELMARKKAYQHKV